MTGKHLNISILEEANMKQTIVNHVHRRRSWFFTILVFLMIAVIIPPQQACAAKNYMKKVRGLQWDLKKGRPIRTKLFIADVGLRDYSICLTRYKVSKPDRNGMKTLTYTMRYTPEWIPTEEEVSKIVNSDALYYHDLTEGYLYNLQPDFYTGYDLEFWKKSPVKMKLGEWRESNIHYYYDDDWNSYYTCTFTQTNTIKFPKNYKGLCIVAGTSHYIGEYYSDTAYLKGRRPFGSTGFYRQSISSFHAMRVK